MASIEAPYSSAGTQAYAAPRLGLKAVGRAGAGRWLMPAILALCVTLLVEVPHIIAGAQQQRGLDFVGMFWSPHDVSQYLAAMREGATGAWLITDHLSGESHEPVLMYAFYVLLGKVVAATGGDFETGYLAASAGARLILLLAISWATGLVADRHGPRLLTSVLVLFGSGLTSILGVVSWVTGMALTATGAELNRPEVSTFLVLFTAPHLMLGLALVLGIARAVTLASAGRRGAALASVVQTVALGFVNPFSLATVVVVLAVFVGVQAVRCQSRVNLLAGVGGVVAAASPFLLYSALIFTGDPFWGATYGKQNQTLSDSPLDLLVGLGVLVPLAVAGALRVRRAMTPGRTLVLVWIAVSIVLMYLPVGFQRRFAYGLHPMVALLAACGLPPLWRWLDARRTGIGMLGQFGGKVVLAQALFGSTAFLYVVCLLGAGGPPAGAPPAVGPLTDRVTFQPASVRAAADWLALQVTPTDIVLSHTVTGNLLAGIVPGRAYVGHWVATLEFSRKQGEMAWFYAAPLDEDRARFLLANRIRYVVYGPYERALSAGPSAGPPSSAANGTPATLRLAFVDDDVAVYEVVAVSMR